MSYRVGHDSAEVAAVAVLGEGPLAKELALACGAGLELPASCVGLPDPLDLPATMPEADRLVAIPLLGLLGERLLVPPTLDFAHPRRAPDAGARRRQGVLAGIAALAALAAGGVYFASQDLGRLRQSAKIAGDRRATLEDRWRDILLSDARLRHAERWVSADPDWLAHVGWLSETMPDTRRAQLDSLSGLLRADVSFSTKDGSYLRGAWGTSRDSEFTLEGRAAREVANELRSRLVASKLYTLDSLGADTPDRFKYVLTSPAASPAELPAPALAKEGP
jgi:hypothetical protein